MFSVSFASDHSSSRNPKEKKPANLQKNQETPYEPLQSTTLPQAPRQFHIP